MAPVRSAPTAKLRGDLPEDRAALLALAVTCRRAPGFDLWHVGVLYREGARRPLRLLEMLGDQLLRDVDATGYGAGFASRYAWAPVPLAGDAQARALAHVSLVGRWVRQRGAGVRLGFAYGGETFDATSGAWAPAVRGRGLYCASTVLAVFLGAGVELVDRAAWPHAAVMDDWIEHFAEVLREARELDRRQFVLGEKGCGHVVYHPRALMAVCLAGKVGLTAAEAAALEGAVETQYFTVRPDVPR